MEVAKVTLADNIICRPYENQIECPNFVRRDSANYFAECIVRINGGSRDRIQVVSTVRVMYDRSATAEYPHAVVIRKPRLLSTEEFNSALKLLPAKLGVPVYISGEAVKAIWQCGNAYEVWDEEAKKTMFQRTPYIFKVKEL